MIRTKTLGVLAITAALGWAAVARADGLDPKHIAADAKWLLHVDADAARQSAVVIAAFQELHSCLHDADQKDKGPGGHKDMDRSEHKAKSPADHKDAGHVDHKDKGPGDHKDTGHASPKISKAPGDYRAKVCPIYQGKGCPACSDKGCPACTEQWGVNVQKDLHDVTVYGDMFSPKHAVVVVRAKFNQDVLKKKLQEKVSAEVTEHDGVTIYTWSGFGHGPGRHRALAFYKPDVLVFGGSWKAVSDAVDVLAGKAPSLAAGSPLAARTPAGTIFVARAVGIDQIDGHHPILSQIHSVDCASGEHGGQWSRNVSVTTTSPEAAGRLNDALKGWIALVSLYFHDQPAMTQLLSQAKTSVQDKTLHVTFTAAAHDVVAQIPVIAKIIKHHLERHHEMHEHWMHEHWMHEHWMHEHWRHERHEEHDCDEGHCDRD